MTSCAMRSVFNLLQGLSALQKKLGKKSLQQMARPAPANKFELVRQVSSRHLTCWL